MGTKIAQIQRNYIQNKKTDCKCINSEVTLHSSVAGSLMFSFFLSTYSYIRVLTPQMKRLCT